MPREGGYRVHCAHAGSVAEVPPRPLRSAQVPLKLLVGNLQYSTTHQNRKISLCKYNKKMYFSNHRKATLEH